ncbi:MAG: enoyl-CoA hydratase-related protein [Planctomycetaceae bacterium]|nr:enoyl-CoA hydratase-related protein [Planctomycetaceae bacterium]
MEYRNKLITVEKQGGGVCLVSLNNPPLNVVTLPLLEEMRDVMAKLEADDAVRVVVLTGSGVKAFSVGSDVKEFPDVWDDVVEKKLKGENEAFNALEFLPKPVIAALEGTVCGGGCEMAMACDIRILSDQGKMGMPEINLGIFPASGGLFRLPKLVGMAKAMEIMYLGDFVDAAECHRIGLVNRLAPAGQVKEAALELARTIAAKPAAALRTIKQGVRDLGMRTTEDGFLDNLRYSRPMWNTPDCAEGVRAFLEKRPPRFAPPPEE